MTSSQMGRVNIDLHDLCLVRIKLPPGKVCAQHQQRVAVQQGMVAGLIAEHPGHSDVVWVVKLEEVLCARRMRDRRLQLVGNRENLLMRPLQPDPPYSTTFSLLLRISAISPNSASIGRVTVLATCTA